MESKPKLRVSIVMLALLVVVWVPAVIFGAVVYWMELWLQAGLILLPFDGWFLLRR